MSDNLPLPPEFIDKSGKHSIQFGDNRYEPIYGSLFRLPFTSLVPNADVCCLWDVPRAGGYTGGCETGEALANLYLKHLREHGADPAGTLQGIVFDMLGIKKSSNEAIQTLRGQMVGFFSELDRWLGIAAQQQGLSLDSMEEQELLKQANNGLNFDEKAYMATLSSEDD